MLYPVLHRMEDEGWIASRWGAAETGRKRKYYSLKKKGKKALEDQRDQWVAVLTCSSNCGRNSMFDPEQAIAKWRREMLAAGVKTPVPLEELEIHLREEIERLTKSGVSEAEAIKTALLKIGPAPAVQNEFRKIEAIKAAQRGKRIDILMTVPMVLMLLSVTTSLLGKVGNLSDLTPRLRWSGLAAVSVSALLTWGGRLGWGMLPPIQSRKTRMAVGIVCGASAVVAWLALFYVYLPRHDFTIGELVIAVLWGFVVPGAASIGFDWGMAAAVWKRAGTVGS